MKKIIAVIQNERVKQSKIALEMIGINSVAVLQVRNRGREESTMCTAVPGFSLQQGKYVSMKHKPELNPHNKNSVDPGAINREFQRGFLPKTMLIMVVSKEEVLPVVHALIMVNQSESVDDGEIFICPIVNVMDLSNDDDSMLILQ